MVPLVKASKPTMYFIGVTTSQSSVMKLFPLWVDILGLKDAILKGIDLPIHAPAEQYRRVVRFIKEDELSLGALVTTHKIDIFEAAGDIFDYLDEYAVRFRELSSICKDRGRLLGYARDPISSRLAMKAFIPPDYWLRHSGEAFIMGAGGSAIAIISNLLHQDAGSNVPSKIHISNRSEARLNSIKSVITQFGSRVPIEYHLCPAPEQNDAVLSGLRPYSLVVNATGLGKDRPGSPLTDAARFPEHSLIWELNYRGKLDFMHQAYRQAAVRGLHVEDGWKYFIHGWTVMMSDVFHVQITPELFERIERISSDYREGRLIL